MKMYYLVHSNDVVNAVKAFNETDAWDYFAAVKKLELNTLQSMGYSVIDKRPALDEE